MHVTDVSHVSYQVFRFDSTEGKKKLGEDRYLSVLASVSHTHKKKKIFRPLFFHFICNP